MDAILHIDIVEILKTIFHTAGIGYIVIFAVIFAESGLFVGFFLPGDSLLFTAGLLASQGIINIWILIGVVTVGAISGVSTGYAFGYKVGPVIFKRENSRLFKKENLMRAENFYEKYGAKTIVLARFIPFIRTFAPIVAGVGKMKYKTFIIYNIIGGIIWATVIPFTGYYLFKYIPDIDKYLLPIIVVIIIVSAIPAILEFFRSKRKNK
jgi:membrane-associated protein